MSATHIAAIVPSTNPTASEPTIDSIVAANSHATKRMLLHASRVARSEALRDACRFLNAAGMHSASFVLLEKWDELIRWDDDETEGA